MDLPKSLLNKPSLLQKIFDLIQLESIIINKNHEIIWMNKEKNKNHPDIKIGDKCYKSFGYASPCNFCLMAQAEELNKTIKNPVCLVDDKKRDRHVNIQLSPIFEDTGEIFGFIEIIDNVENLYQANIRLEYLNKEYESVIYALSHDLRSPLVSIEGFLRKVLNGHIDTEDKVAMHCVKRIHANVETMNNLVKVLLDTSRIATGAMDIRNVGLNNLIESVVRQLHLNADEKHVKIKIVGEYGTVECDEIRIKQVYRNLIINALQHCSEEKELIIEIGNDNGIYWVKDNGPGIPEKIKDKIFEPFFMGEKVSKDSFGMGMNIVYKIIEKHNGKIWIESVEHEGTAVYFTLGR